MPLAAFKALVREQFNILLIDTEAALAAIPAMLPPDAETRLKAFDADQDRTGRARRNDRRGYASDWLKSPDYSASMPRATPAPTPFRQIAKGTSGARIMTMRQNAIGAKE